MPYSHFLMLNGKMPGIQKKDTIQTAQWTAVSFHEPKRLWQQQQEQSNVIRTPEDGRRMMRELAGF